MVSYLTTTLTEFVLSLTVGHNTSHAIWTCLQQHFSQQYIANATNIQFQLFDMSKGNKTISEYLLHAKSLAVSLAYINEPVSNADLVTAILRGLGPNYAMLVTAILNFPPLPNYFGLRARLLSFESQMNHSSVVPAPATALLANHASPPPRGPSQFFNSPRSNYHAYPRSGRGGCGGRGGRPRSPWHNGSSNNNDNWNHLGHWNNGSWNNSGSFNSFPCGNWNSNGAGVLGNIHSNWCLTCSTNHHAAATCPHCFGGPDTFNAPFAGAQVLQYQDPNWYPDTSATHYMTGNVAAVQNSTPYNGNTSVLLGNDDNLNIAHTGTISFSLSSLTLPLKNALYVSSLNKNLLSVARFTLDNSISFLLHPTSYKFFGLHTGCLLFQGPCKDGLYPISFSHPQALAVLSSSMWHNRLSHPSSSVLSHLGSSLSSTFRNKNFFCKGCALGKSTQLPFVQN